MHIWYNNPSILEDKDQIITIFVCPTFDKHFGMIFVAKS